MHKNESKNLTPKTHQKLPTVAVVGARGYSGLELVRILLNHSGIDLKYCFATEAFSLKNYFSNPKIDSVECYAQTEIFNYPADIVFLATPAEVSMKLAPKLIENKSLVIDVSGAFRLKNNSYETWYGFEHEQKELLASATYGLNPWASPMAKNSLIANPGCYATSVLMALIPLLKENVIDTTSIVVDAKSGTTGGGKKAAENLLYSEVDGECLPYKIGKHQHYPEIQEYVSKFSGKNIDFHFSTSLLAARRGIISSIFAKLNKGVTEKDIENVFAKHYVNQPMVKFGSLKNNPQLASLKKVVGTNNTFISYTIDNNKLYVFSVIDNLVKGAAGQAIENMNKNLDYPVDQGLAQLEALQ
jgi:N-acetyl-gamma-glutamyl-phosphate reductase